MAVAPSATTAFSKITIVASRWSLSESDRWKAAGVFTPKTYLELQQKSISQLTPWRLNRKRLEGNFASDGVTDDGFGIRAAKVNSG